MIERYTCPEILCSNSGDIILNFLLWKEKNDIEKPTLLAQEANRRIEKIISEVQEEGNQL